MAKPTPAQQAIIDKAAQYGLKPDSTPRATVAKGAVKISTLQGKSGVLGGQHAGGNSDVAAEKMLQSKVNAGKVKDLTATKQQIAKKTGSWPNGATN